MTAGPVGPEVFWRVIPDGQGGYFTGTGHGGEIHHTDRRRTKPLVASLGAPRSSVCWCWTTEICWPAAGPRASCTGLTTRGEATLLGSVPGGYIWAMAAAPGKGTRSGWPSGSPAAVYRFDRTQAALDRSGRPAGPECPGSGVRRTGPPAGRHPGARVDLPARSGRAGQPRLLFETAQDEVRQVHHGPGREPVRPGPEYRGRQITQGNGVQPGAEQPVAPPALLSLMLDADGPEIPRAALYRLEADGLVTPWWTGEVDLMIAAWSPRWGWLGGGPLTDESGRTGSLRPDPAGGQPSRGRLGRRGHPGYPGDRRARAGRIDHRLPGPSRQRDGSR